MTTDELKKILDAHKLWVDGDGGARANLSGADLRGLDLRGAYLLMANLRGAKLWRANLCGAILSRSDLSGAILCGAILSRSDLSGAKLWRANLSEADLRGANLRGANLREANLRGANGVVSGKLFNYTTHIIGDFIAIGCKTLNVEEWEELTEEGAREMDDDAVKAFNSNEFKTLIQQAKDLRGNK